MIPFSPPRIDDKTIEAVTEVLKSGWITTGPRTKQFEKEITAYVGAQKTICLNSWTNAAELVLRWFGVKEGDEVIIPAYTYTATANIVKHLGAIPVMVDIAKPGFHIDPKEIEKHLSKKTKVIMPVDIGGAPCDYTSIRAILDKCDFYPDNEVQKQLGRPLLLSDAAHSFGASLNGKMAGSLADVSGFSFHAVKNLTTAEGGALSFNLPKGFDLDEIYKWFNTMSLHGQTKDALSKTTTGGWRYDVIAPGFKCNMTDLQAAIGLVELERYESDTLKRRKEICDDYHAEFSKQSWAELPLLESNDFKSSFHLYMLRIKAISENQRDLIIDKIVEKGVSVNVHFLPLPMLTAYKKLGYKIDDYPNTYDAYSREISLPVYYNLSKESVAVVIKSVIESVEEIIN